MNSGEAQAISICHAVAMPFPGRGHINPMMNLCKLLSSRKHEILITFVVTEEWLGFIGSDPKPENMRFETIPNVIPPERLKAADFPFFYEAVMTKMEAPFERLLDRLEPPVSVIIGDVEVRWAIGVGKRRNIPVAAFWTMSATFFSLLHHVDLHIKQKDANVDLIERVDTIPEISSSDVADLRKIFHRDGQRVLKLALECISRVPEAQYLLFTSVYELEPQVVDALRTALSFPVHPIGPAIPYLELQDGPSEVSNTDYLKWLDSQQKGSVLYISLGSFLSVSSAQMDEIVAGLRISGVRFLWVARGEASRLSYCCGDSGLVIQWSDQLKVLTHPSVGGFWTHCGWNSTLEAVFSGVPMLTFPLFLDQDTNSRQILEDWKVGWRVNTEQEDRQLMTREDVAGLVRRFMDSESSEGKEIRRRARKYHKICQLAIAESGSSSTNLDAFIDYISRGHNH